MTIVDKNSWVHVNNKDSFEFDTDILGVPGLRWERVPSVGGGGGNIRVTSSPITTMIDRDNDAGEYPHYGIHQFQADGLVFVRGAKDLYVDIVDCRANSETLHKAFVIETSPDSSRCLRIPPGVAHRPGPLSNMLTWNLIIPYWDIRIKSPQDGFDVINCSKDCHPNDMPILETAKWPIPKIWLTEYLMRMISAAQSQKQYPVKSR